MRRPVLKNPKNLSKEAPKTPAGGLENLQFSFGPFVLDPAEHRLERHGAAVRLTPRLFSLLLALVERAGHLVTKEALLRRVWPGTVVEEANLSVQVSLLRRVLGKGRDSAGYVETVPKVGYRFVAPVRVLSARQSDTDPTRLDGAPQPAGGRDTTAGPDERVRLTVQVVRLRDGETLWSESVEGLLREPLRAQERITEELATILTRLSPGKGRPSMSP